MRRISTLIALILGLVAGAARAAQNSAELFPASTIFAVDSANMLLHFNAAAPGQSLGAVPLIGVEPGETVLGIDFRPATGQLYGLGSTSRIYVIDAITGKATAVGGPFGPLLTGTDFGFDFDPRLDRIRVVSDAEQNLRIHPDTGAVVGVDGAINPAGNLVAAAYSQNFSGTAATVLYGIDSDTDLLVIQNPPVSGNVFPVGPLGVDTSGLTGFDIAAGTGIAFASLTAPAAPTSSLYSVNPANGVASLVGTIGGSTTICDIAVVTGPELVFALTTGGKLIVFESDDPEAIVKSDLITGLQVGETLLAIDFRPATGELFGLGSTSRLYRIDAITAAATAVGGAPFTPALSGTDFGFDFNPTVDRIRIVSDAEQNLRLNPSTGQVSFTDVPLNPAGNVVAAAYTNNFAGATSTTLYDLDSSSDLLLLQNPPNNGVLSAVGPLQLDFTGLAGFDISANGVAFAALTPPVGFASGFYRVNLASGAATLVGAIGGGQTIRDIAVRLFTEIAYIVTEGAFGVPPFNLVRLSTAAPGFLLSTVPITGLLPGERIVGIDFRPVRRELFAVGSTSRLLVLDPQTGALTPIGSGFTPALSGTSFGVDFNPTVDRLRIVSNAEQNLRLNPTTGTVAFTDAPLNPAGNVVAAAYVNNFVGSATTTLYDIDSVSDSLLVQNPPNDGVLIPVGELGVDIGEQAGFDVVRGTGNAYVAAYPGVATQPSLYRINLSTGALTSLGTINIPTTDRLAGLSVIFETENPLFCDGFETGDGSRWSDLVP